MAIRNSQVTTVILAGGLGTRMGGDKGLQALHGKPLISWVLDAVGQESGEVLINANDSLQAYAQFGCRLIADQMPGWPGPLAGLQAALRSTNAKYVMTVPCDTPFLPDKLISKLRDALEKNETEAAVAKVDGCRQPAIALYAGNVLPKLDEYLVSGRRKVNDWLGSLALSEVEFKEVHGFDNINTREELAQANQLAIRIRNRI
jgi:molybdenum cofactor guanylyltransferase